MFWRIFETVALCAIKPLVADYREADAYCRELLELVKKTPYGVLAGTGCVLCLRVQQIHRQTPLLGCSLFSAVFLSTFWSKQNNSITKSHIHLVLTV
uniref:Putative secreted peptide n=1 Tax=Anopheles braziliensis TaxID=58242 RepID=A0A2M3ZVW8_9DIPT